MDSDNASTGNSDYVDFAVHHNGHDNYGRHNQNPTANLPQSPNVFMRKCPCVFILHGHGSSVARCITYMVGCVFCILSTDIYHRDRQKQNNY